MADDRKRARINGGVSSASFLLLVRRPQGEALLEIVQGIEKELATTVWRWHKNL